MAFTAGGMSGKSEKNKRKKRKKLIKKNKKVARPAHQINLYNNDDIFKIYAHNEDLTCNGMN
jgi:hypothetical protein